MKPILFNTEMVRAILDGRKTCTRRLLQAQPPRNAEWVKRPDGYWMARAVSPKGITDLYSQKPRYSVGDILWVRETWKQFTSCPSGGGYHIIDGYLYKADEPQDTTGIMTEDKWHPSIHMPKKAARIFLRVKDVRPEHLQDIDEEGVCNEGAEPLIICHFEHGVINPDGTLGDMCYNTNECRPCPYISKSYGEMFGERVWNLTLKPADRAIYGWKANPWVWVISFEQISKEEAGA